MGGNATVHYGFAGASLLWIFFRRGDFLPFGRSGQSSTLRTPHGGACLVRGCGGCWLVARRAPAEAIRTIRGHNAKPLAARGSPHIDNEKKEKPMSQLHSIKTGSIRRGFVTAAAVALFGMAGSAAVHAQATAGEVFGNAPAGSTVLAKSTTTGTQREVQADEKGRYAIRALPIGVYTVTLSENGQPVAKHVNVPVVVGRGIKVDFDGQASATGQQ